MMVDKNGSDITRRLTGGRLLAKNALWNMAGQAVPLIVALFTIPVLIRELGVDRFGLVTLAWIVIGYFSLFDLGMGRALTKVLAEKTGLRDDRQLSVIVWTTLLLMVSVSTVASLALCLLLPALVHHLLNIPDTLEAETLEAFYLLAVSLPFVISTSGLRGILEAQQRFGFINVIRVFMGIFTFLGPMLVLPFSKSLVPIVIILLIVRIGGWALHLALCLQTMPTLRRIEIKLSALRPLLHFGAWITVSSIISPLMVYLDRFFIGAIVSISAVTYYTTPYEVVTKLWLIPGALVGVLFPAFAASFAVDRDDTARLFNKGVKYVFLLLFPVIFLIVAFSNEGLSLWLGTDFAGKSSSVLQWLATGVLINSLSQIPYSLLQSVGRPDITGKLHLVELPFYILTVLLLGYWYGIEGIAIAWVARVVFDSSLLFYFSAGVLPKDKLLTRQRPVYAVMIGSLIILLIAVAGPMSIIMKSAFTFAVLASFVTGAWFFILSADERMILHNAVKSFIKRIPVDEESV